MRTCAVKRMNPDSESQDVVYFTSMLNLCNPLGTSGIEDIEAFGKRS